MDDTFATTETIFVHSKRKEAWGYAILAFERDDRRGYQFEDGRLREFKHGYYELIEPVSPKPEGTSRIISNLKAMLAKTVDDRVRPTKVPEKATLSVDALVTVAKELFPEAFQAEEYLTKVRGRDAKRRLKRHRDGAIADAQERLAKASFSKLTPAEAHGVLRSVIGTTDLVTAKQIAPLDNVPPESYEELQAAVIAMLHGKGPYEARFERYVQILEQGGSVGWELATAATAMMHPDKHMWIKATPMKRFVARFSPGISITPNASGFTYSRLLEIGEKLSQRVEEEGIVPEDFFDVMHLLTEVTKAPAIARLEALSVE